MGNKKDTIEPHHQKDGYEKSDVNLKMTGAISGLLLTMLAVFVVLLNEFFLVESEKEIQKAILAPESVALRDLRARETEIINGYRVVDAAKGIYAIPVSRAMELLAAESYKASVQEKVNGVVKSK